MARKVKQRYYNNNQVIWDAISIFFGLTAIIVAVITFINFSNNIVWAPLIFLLAAFMNISLAVKSFQQREKTRGIFRIVQSIVLIAIGIVMFITTR